ncbi:hypothetical protein [Segniliparus rugosus]|uniref:Uncharacterized protein n=1 Tax=Segniliparus rugosus (strain ATCC BAA-974 / DSM 45345 / CCUG 50838 / CIP 108380 / JCM 13579 / CDC 945) TaxID=679197 RepID=E5XNQ8_SEGRC|nr:hypothetical protein [Segniliparus rugosus]EFV14048.1 hypothetical protein HMPREF9336_01129 [Segniliparus rugosus ATCC BAA-974]
MIRPRTALRPLPGALFWFALLCCAAETAKADPPIIPMPGDPSSPAIGRRTDLRNQDDFGRPSNKIFPENGGSPHMSVQTNDPLPSNEHPIIKQ